MSSAPKDANTIIGKDSSFTGTFKATGVLHIEGTFEGKELRAHQVYVLSDGVVKATIKGESIFIEGTVVGPIFATSRVFLLPGSQITGDITTPELITQKGVVLNGYCKIEDHVIL